MRILVFLIFLTTMLCAPIFGQSVEKALLFNIKYGIHIPGGDLSDRFGTNFMIGLDAEYYHGGMDLFFGLQGNFIFSDRVKEDVLAPIRTSEGELIGRDQSFAFVDLRQRGIVLGGHVGKLFSIWENGHKIGLRLSLGGGVMMHRIALKDENETANQVAGEYGKGYNRKTAGAYLNQFVGFQMFSADRRINFRAGFIFHQGFTDSVRSVNLDTKKKGAQNRLDLFHGFEVGWILPIFFSEPQAIYY